MLKKPFDYFCKMRKLSNHELNRKGVVEFKKATKTPIIIILDDVRSLHNIGSVFRTADAFLIEEIILCGITATPPHKDIHKTALGATDTVSWQYASSVVDAIDTLQKKGIIVHAIEQAEGAILLDNVEIDASKTHALVFGNEVKGVHQEVVSQSNSVIEIPQIGTKHSLNISVSVGIVCWTFFKMLRP